MHAKLAKLTGLFTAVAISMVAFCGNAVAQSSLESIKKKGIVEIGWAEWRPLEYKDIASGELKGVLIDIAKEIAARLAAKPEFVQDNWATLPAGIAANKFQISLMGVSDGRARVVDFSTPIYHTPFAVIAQKTQAAKTFNDINVKGNSIAVTTGSNTDEALTSLEKQGKIMADVVRIKDVGGAVLSLTSGKVTAFASSTDSLAQVIVNQPDYRILDGDFGASLFSVAVPKDAPDLKAAVDDVVKKMVADGTIARLLQDHKVVGTIVGSK